jgi:Asp-tRNA(Asn)/Glu-tRNA(Gln) amidotransferase A subunit family amidase
MPVGLQMVARSHRETDIFRAAAALEACQPWAGSKPIVSQV